MLLKRDLYKDVNIEVAYKNLFLSYGYNVRSFLFDKRFNFESNQIYNMQ